MLLPPTAMTLSTAHQPAVPEIISCWRLGPQITGGHWYHLYRAAPKTVAPQAPHDFVLKLVNPYLGRDEVPRAIDRLGREALATEQIVHPNVIRLLDSELDQAPFYLVQPWIHGRTLDRLFSRVPHLPLTRMLWVLRQIAEGVQAGHDKGRALLGLDPTHVLLGGTGRVTLIGWSQSHGFGERAWFPDQQLQAARYLAPECLEPDYRAIPASDVYALGALIHHALSLKPCFDGGTVEQIRLAHRHKIPENLLVSQPLCPPRLAYLVKEMLAKNPQRRPAFGDVLNELISIEIAHLSDTTLIPL